MSDTAKTARKPLTPEQAKKIAGGTHSCVKCKIDGCSCPCYLHNCSCPNGMHDAHA